MTTIAAPSISTLERDVASLGLRLSSAQVAKLQAYVALLAKWNRTYNLTAIREPDRMVTHHLLDALAVLPHLPSDASDVLDVGTGPGVPGIPLAIARDDWNVTLVDSSSKKIAFMTQACAELGLGNARPIAARVEDMSSDRTFDLIVSRAFSDLRSFVVASRMHLGEGGRWYAMKGVLPRDEIAALPSDVDVIDTPELHVPGLDAQRHLVIMQMRASRP